MKRLLICRHAKSSWKDRSVNDFDRPLNKRGKHDAPIIGQRLRIHGLVPDLIFSSPAQRALITALTYAQELGYPQEKIATNQSQYAASVARLLTLIQETEASVVTLMMVGHNPESTMLANFLSGLRIENIPTSGVVALEFAIQSWKEIQEAEGRLLEFEYPKKQFTV